jgi:hypothetical protein
LPGSKLYRVKPGDTRRGVLAVEEWDFAAKLIGFPTLSDLMDKPLAPHPIAE